jgi:glucan 1,3-beta-glucosidase
MMAGAVELTVTGIYIGIGVAILVIAIIVVVAVEVTKNNSGGSSAPSTGIGSIAPSSIPAGAPSWLDPYDWADTTDFNITYTNDTVGDLPIMGLNSTWDDSAAANPYVPALNAAWGNYSSRPARGVNLGGWLSIEPFITPSLFNSYAAGLGIIDEYTLCRHLGPNCAATLESHYSTFVTE